MKAVSIEMIYVSFFYRHASIKSVVVNEALGWQPPYAYHVYCVRHIAKNFNHKFKNEKQKEMLKKLGKI